MMQWSKQTASLAALLGDLRRTLDAGSAAQNDLSDNGAPAPTLAGKQPRGTALSAGGTAVTHAIDYPRLASAIAAAMTGVTVQMDGHTVGALVEPTVSEKIAKATKMRR